MLLARLRQASVVSRLVALEGRQRQWKAVEVSAQEREQALVSR